MIELIRRIADYIFADRKKVKERLGDIMGGKVLELETDKLIKIGEEKGIEKGIQATIRTCKNFNINKYAVIKNLMKEFSLSEEDAVSYIKKYW